MTQSANTQNPLQKLSDYVGAKLLLLFVIALSFSFLNTNAQTPGSNDNSFNPGTGLDSFVDAISLQSDGKIIIGGAFFSSYNGASRNNIARVNTDGTLDATFNPGTGTGSVRTTFIQSDGKIIIGGRFASYNGTARNNIARINMDGSLDGTFDAALTGDFTDVIYTCSQQSNGKIIIGGYFGYPGGVSTYSISRLNSDGSMDNAFNQGGTGLGNSSAGPCVVWTTAIQSDGKIIIGGQFDSYNGLARNYITRVNSDGSLDATFDIGTGLTGWPYGSAIQNDGKIIVGGGFTLYNGISVGNIVRLNTDGSIDNTFNQGTGANGLVWKTVLQNDGKIIIVGEFTSYNGVPRKNIARLNADGSLDTNFDTSVGANEVVYSVAIQSDDKIIIGGDFTSYDNVSRNCIARIHGVCESLPSPTLQLGASVPNICVGAITTITTTATYGGSLPVYQWKVNGTNVGTNTTTYVNTFNIGDEISCELTSNYVCASTPTAISNTITVQSCVGVAEQAQTKNVIYNNSTNTLNVSERGNLVIYNMQGTKVKELKVNSQAFVSVSAEDLGGTGVYIWQLQTEKEVQRGKIIVQE